MTVHSRDIPIVCTLSPAALDGRLADWQALLTYTVRRIAAENGTRIEFTSEVPLGDLARLVAAEQACCQFLSFAITVDPRGVALEVTAPEEARSIIESLFGGTP